MALKLTSVGRSVGDTVGLLLGFFDGESVGFAEGLTVGFVLGLREGFLDGAIVDSNNEAVDSSHNSVEIMVSVVVSDATVELGFSQNVTGTVLLVL